LGAEKNNLKNFLIYNTSVWIPVVLNFLLLPVFTAYLTPADYGMRAIVFLAILILEILTNFGINWVIRSKYFSFSNTDERNRYLSSLFIILFFPRILVLIVFMLGTDILFPTLFNDWSGVYTELFKIQLMIFLINYPNEIFFAIYILERQSKRFSSLVLIKYFSNTIISLVALIIFKKGVFSLFYGELFGVIMFQLISIIHFRSDFTYRFDKTVITDILRIGIPAMPKSLFQTIQLNIDKYILQIFLPVSDIGIFSKSQFVNKGVSGFNKAFSNAYSPSYLKKMNEDGNDISARNIMTYWILFISIILVFSILFLSDIFRVMGVNKQFWICATYAPFYAMNILITSYALMYGNNILLSGKTYYFTYRSIFSGLTNIIANIILIPIYGITGAIFATLISAITFFLIELYISEVRLHYSTNINLGIYGFSLLIITIVFYLIYNEYLISLTLRVFIMFTLTIIVVLYENYYLGGELKKLFSRILDYNSY
jgi:O-antigen/teichoic acid export membrane protein